MQYELSLLGINKSYGLLKANDNIDLFVRKGSIHTIIGENGRQEYADEYTLRRG